MSLCPLIYNNTRGISSANDLLQIMAIGNQLYSRSVMISQAGVSNAVRVTNSVKCV